MNRNVGQRGALRRSIRGSRRGYGRGRRRRCRCGCRLRSVPVKDCLHVVRIGPAVDDIVVRCSCLPEHNTTKSLGILVHVLRNQRLNLGRIQVETLNGHVRTGRQTDKELRVRVCAAHDDFHPVIKVESRVPIALHKVSSRASFSIVELDPDKIKCGVGDGVAQLSVGNRALWCT